MKTASNNAAATALIFVMLFMPGEGLCKEVGDYVNEAITMIGSGDFNGAENIMLKGLEEHPENADVYAHLGGAVGMQVQQSRGLDATVIIMNRSFKLLDKAVSLDQEHVYARFYRGVLSANAPEFMGRLDQAVGDLGLVLNTHRSSPGALPLQIVGLACDFLGTVHTKLGNNSQARQTWSILIEQAPGTPFAEQAEKKIAEIKDAKDEELITVNKLAYDIPAIKQLANKLDKQPESPDALFALAKAFFQVSYLEYDERTYLHPGFRTYLVVEAIRLLDLAIDSAPDNMEMRIYRGRAAVDMPFFVFKFDQAVEDMNMIIASDAPEKLKSEAMFLLGRIGDNRRKSSWAKLALSYPESREAGMIAESSLKTTPAQDHAKGESAGVFIEFDLDFHDFLAPQVAVWIKDAEGTFVKSVYVSGFSGFAREKQVNLVEYSKSSDFSDVDAVTSASIDIGSHRFCWDLRDSNGDEVRPGKYTVHVEASFYPAFKHRTVSLPVTVGKKTNRKSLKEGKYIPRFEVEYIPE